MATGRLGNGTTGGSANTNVQAYQVPTGYYAVFNISVTNTNATSITLKMAMSTSSTAGGVAASEYIESGTTVIGNGVFERTGLVAGAGMYIWVQSSATSGVNYTVYGIETSTT
jgi:hypothetical protein